jgi:N-acetylmuramoyl-L-alanine amidase
MRRFTALFGICFFVNIIHASEPSFHKVDVREGEGVYSLLRRYGLSDQSSISKFYELNKLNPEAPLIVGKEYYLPVLVYQYDGKSIRSTIGIDDWDLAVRIAAFNRTLQERGLRETSYEKSKILWVPYFELGQKQSSVTKPVEKPVEEKLTMRVPLFGEKYESVTVQTQKLKGKVFYVVSGHGGPDPGAMSEAAGHTICEDEYAYDVSLRLARALMEHGAIVEMVVQDPNDGIRSNKYLKCDKDEVTLDNKQMPINQLLRLQQRVHNINTLHKEYWKEGFKDQTVICIHVDSRGPSSRQDVFFYYYQESEAGKRIALSLQETFRKKYAQNRAGRGYCGTVTCRSLYELRHTDPKAVYVELANIQNAADLRRILPEGNRQALANWLCEGLMAAQ